MVLFVLLGPDEDKLSIFQHHALFVFEFIVGACRLSYGYDPGWTLPKCPREAIENHRGSTKMPGLFVTFF